MEQLLPTRILNNQKVSWGDDLEIYISHGGTEVMLFDQSGGASDNMTQVLFDDEAATGIGTRMPPYGPGSFIPKNSLSAFDGASLAGDWTLRIEDTFVFDSGMLNAFRIEGETVSGPGGSPVPEPTSMVLFGIGLLGLAGVSRRKQK